MLTSHKVETMSSGEINKNDGRDIDKGDNNDIVTLRIINNCGKYRGYMYIKGVNGVRMTRENFKMKINTNIKLYERIYSIIDNR